MALFQSLRRFRGAGYFYSVRSYDATVDVEQFLTETVNEWGEIGEFKYIGKSKIEFGTLEERLNSIIIIGGALNLQNVSNDESKASIKKMVVEDINEYYGLASTSLNSDGIFHPLISRPVYEVNPCVA